LQTFHGVEKTPLFYYNNQHQEKRFGGSKKGIRFSKKFFETHRKPHGYWVPVISVTKDKQKQTIFLMVCFCLGNHFCVAKTWFAETAATARSRCGLCSREHTRFSAKRSRRSENAGAHRTHPRIDMHPKS